MRVTEQPDLNNRIIHGADHRVIWFTTPDCSGTPYIRRQTFLGLTLAVRSLDPVDQANYWVAPISLYSQAVTIDSQSKIMIDPFSFPPSQCIAAIDTVEVIEGVRLSTDLNQFFSAPLRLVVSGEKAAS